MSLKKSEIVSPLSPSTSIARIDIRQLQPLPSVIPYGTNNYLFTLSGQLIPPVAVDFNKDGSFWSKLYRNTGTLFSKSIITVPESFHMVTSIHRVGSALSIQDIDAMETNNIQLSVNKINFELVHSINQDKIIEHPCTPPSSPSSITMLSTTSTSEKAKFDYLGGKTCAYNTYIAIEDNGAFKPVHLIFYVKNVAGNIITKIRGEHSAVQTAGLVSSFYPNTDDKTWQNLFAIPLVQPEGGLIYHIVPASKEGKTYLFNWLSEANRTPNAKWTAVDDVLIRIDEWESLITLDVRFKEYKEC